MLSTKNDLNFCHRFTIFGRGVSKGGAGGVIAPHFLAEQKARRRQRNATLLLVLLLAPHFQKLLTPLINKFNQSIWPLAFLIRRGVISPILHTFSDCFPFCLFFRQPSRQVPDFYLSTGTCRNGCRKKGQEIQSIFSVVSD